MMYCRGKKKSHEIIEDDDDSLGQNTIDEFEMEANYFASVTLFQHDMFIAELKKLNLDIKSAIHLSKLFGASIHATLRRYVENSAKRCALIVLEKSRGTHIAPGFSKRNYFASRRFMDAFGDVNLPDRFGLQWEFAQDFYYGKRGVVCGEATFTAKSGTETFLYQFFNNSYNGFVFLYPVGEKQSSKTTIILTAAK